jgi:hypothetical protein
MHKISEFLANLYLLCHYNSFKMEFFIHFEQKFVIVCDI